MPCRFALAIAQETLVRACDLKNSFYFKPRFNIAPNQVMPIVRYCPKKGNYVDFIHWGFSLGWGHKGHINARAETILEKPYFKYAAYHQRCIIPATGYYEWKDLKTGKQPYYITPKYQPLLYFAGIWAKNAQDKKNCGQESACILTLPAVDLLATIGERRPLLISEGAVSDWLNPKLSLEKLSVLLKGDYLPVLNCQPVSKQVNSPEVDQVACILPL